MGTFHLTVCGALRAGDVIRVCPPGTPFGDAVILGFDEAGYAKVSRPYAYASSVGTTGASVLMGAETYTLTPANLKHFVDQHDVLATGRTTQ